MQMMRSTSSRVIANGSMCHPYAIRASKMAPSTSGASRIAPDPASMAAGAAVDRGRWASPMVGSGQSCGGTRWFPVRPMTQSREGRFGSDS
jgi:hypothetical protein